MKKILVCLILLFSLSKTYAYDEGRTVFSAQGECLHRWPFAFCPDHLINDPEGCSSWVMVEEDGVKKCVLEKETNIYLYPFYFVDQNLIDKLGSDIYLIPQIVWRGCNHGVCDQCGENIRLGMKMTKEGWIDGFAKCGCLDDFISDEDEELLDEMMENHWHFCGKPTIAPEYFDESFAANNFDRLCNHIAYVKENPSCKCYWSETKRWTHNIMKNIYEDFWYTFDALIFKYSGNQELDKENVLKEYFYADRKLGEHLCFCFSYADIEESLNRFDPAVYNQYCYDTFNRHCYSDKITSENYQAWKTKILNRVREDYLQICRQCYERHPHPNVAKQIEELSSLEEVQGDGEPNGINENSCGSFGFIQKNTFRKFKKTRVTKN